MNLKRFILSVYVIILAQWLTVDPAAQFASAYIAQRIDQYLKVKVVFLAQKNIGLNTGIINGTITYEQHARVNSLEAAGLGAMNFDIVNMAQQLKFDFSGNFLSLTASTDIFPSANLFLNEFQLLDYKQPSFKNTHSITRDYMNE